MKRMLTFAAVFAALLLCQTVQAAPLTSDAPFELTVLHVNDTHSYLDASALKLTLGGKRTYAKAGGWARLKTAVNAVRAGGSNVLLLHAGDAVQGDLFFMRYDGEPEMALLDRFGFDALVPGNHEFDRGPKFLARLLARTAVPVTAANISTPGHPELAARLKPYIVAVRDGRRIGIIGLTTSATADISSPGPDVSFADEIATARNVAEELERHGVDIIILLTHAGLQRDLEFAAAVPGVDIVVGGHSHSLLGDTEAFGNLGLRVEGPYPMTVRGTDGNDVLVVTAWQWGRILGRLDATFDDEGHITAHRGFPTLLLADSFMRKNETGAKTRLPDAEREAAIRDAETETAAVVAPDAATDAFLAPYRKGVEAMRQDVIGTATAPLSHTRVPGTTESGLALPGGSLVGPHICASMLAKLDTTGLRADIALQNAGGIRQGLDQGSITIGSAHALLPFKNTLVTLELTGTHILIALEHGAGRGGGAFPCVAGIRFVADMAKPAGARVYGVEIRSPEEGWHPLDPARTYRLVTNSYLARGGDGYKVLQDIPSRVDTGFVDTNTFIEYVRKRGTLAPPSDTGVTFIPAGQ